MNVIKATLIPIILNYDLRFRDGEGIPKPQYNRILVLVPDKERVVEFRQRKKNE